MISVSYEKPLLRKDKNLQSVKSSHLGHPLPDLTQNVLEDYSLLTRRWRSTFLHVLLWIPLKLLYNFNALKNILFVNVLILALQGLLSFSVCFSSRSSAFQMFFNSFFYPFWFFVWSLKVMIIRDLSISKFDKYK